MIGNITNGGRAYGTFAAQKAGCPVTSHCTPSKPPPAPPPPGPTPPPGPAPPPAPHPPAPVWPLPRHLDCHARATGKAELLSRSVTLKLTGPGAGSSVAVQAATRYQLLLRDAGSVVGQVQEVTVAVESTSDSLGQTTNYSYALHYGVRVENVAGGSATTAVVASAATPFGVGYAMETLLQLATPEAQASCGGGFSVVDEPDYAHRGVLLDTGRRFYPLELLESTIEAMAMFKLNILHLHLNEARFRVESKVFPKLNQPQNCSECGYYSQEDIKRLVSFAYQRGVRVVPEFELTAHAAALCDAWKDEGVPKCCSGIYTPMLPNDTSGNTTRLVGQLLKEMAALFPDPVVHIGGDEARYQPGATGPCTINATRSLQQNTMQQLLVLGKQPMGWQEILLETGAAAEFPTAIVDTWSKPGTWAEVAALGGHRSVVSLPSSLYLDGAATCGGTTHRGSYRPGVWFDITDGAKNGVYSSAFPFHFPVSCLSGACLGIMSSPFIKVAH